MRKLDDIIINTLNTVIPTDSFHPDAPQACKDLSQKIEDGNKTRETAIKKCITTSADRVKHLKERRESDSSNVQITKELRAEQTKVKCVVHFLNVAWLCLFGFVICFIVHDNLLYFSYSVISS